MRSMADVRRLIPREKARLFVEDDVLITDIKNTLKCSYDQLRRIEEEYGCFFRRSPKAKAKFRLTEKFLRDCIKKGYSIERISRMTGINEDVVANKLSIYKICKVKVKVTFPDRIYSDIEKIGLFSPWRRAAL